MLDSNYVPIKGGRDPWTNGIGIFDMTELSWSTGYDTSAGPYDHPGVVKQYYQSNPRTPTWNDPALAGIFSTKTSPNPSPTGNSLNPSQTGNSPNPSSTGISQNTESKHQGKNTRAIEGGTVGGVAGLCVVLALAAFLLRRRRQNGSKTQAPLKPPEELPTDPSTQEISAEPRRKELGPPPPHELGNLSVNYRELEGTSAAAELDPSII